MVRRVRLFALVVLTACNSLTGTNDLESVDCLGDCHVAPGTFCGDGLVCAKSCCVVGGGCSGAKCTCSGETSCASSTITLSCDGPEDCSAPSGACVVQISLAGDKTNCNVTIAATTVAACSSKADGLSVCGGSPTVQLCHKSSDCTGDDQCCPLATNYGALNVCAPLAFKVPGSGCLP